MKRSVRKRGSNGVDYSPSPRLASRKMTTLELSITRPSVPCSSFLAFSPFPRSAAPPPRAVHTLECRGNPNAACASPLPAQKIEREGGGAAEAEALLGSLSDIGYDDEGRGMDGWRRCASSGARESIAEAGRNSGPSSYENTPTQEGSVTFRLVGFYGMMRVNKAALLYLHTVKFLLYHTWSATNVYIYILTVGTYIKS